MSISALCWAFDLQIKPATAKLTLIALADNANDTGCAWPSLETISRKTSLNRKTVVKSLDLLEEIGILLDTGERRGTTRQVKVYRLNGWDEGPHGRTVPKTEPFRSSPETVPFLTSNSTKNGTRNSTKNGTENLQLNRHKNRHIEPSLKGTAASPHGSASPTASVWSAYTEAYESRYHARPLRDAMTNAQMAKFVRRVGADEAPAIAKFYLQHNNRYYVLRQHPVGLLVSDAETLRTQWMTGRRITDTHARQADRTANTVDQISRIIANMEKQGES